MKKCNRCQVIINSEDNFCPLCNNRIEDGLVDEVFPIIPTIYRQHSLLGKILGFLSIFGAILCLILNLFINHTLSWSWFVLAGIGSFWFTVKIAIKRRKHYMKTLFTELNAIIILAIIWDYFTKWHGWSISYVLPLLGVAYTFTVFIMRIFFKEPIKDYIIYVYMNCLIGLLPIILIIFNLVNTYWPAITSIITSFFALTFLYIFNYQSLQKEIKRRFHI